MKSYIIKTLINWYHIHIDEVLLTYCNTYEVCIKMGVHYSQWASSTGKKKSSNLHQNLKQISKISLKHLIKFLFLLFFIFMQLHTSNFHLKTELHKYFWKKEKMTLEVFMIWLREENTRNLMWEHCSHEISNQFYRPAQSE